MCQKLLIAIAIVPFLVPPAFAWDGQLDQLNSTLRDIEWELWRANQNARWNDSFYRAPRRSYYRSTPYHDYYSPYDFTPCYHPALNFNGTYGNGLELYGL